MTSKMSSSSSSASSLDHFTHVVRQLSSAANLRDLAQFVVKSQDMLSRCPESNLCTTADALEVTNHTIGVTAILTALLRRPSTSTLSDADFGSNIYGRVSAFLAECNPEHVRFCPEQLAEMIRTLSDELIRREKPILAVSPLRRAIAILQTSPTTLKPTPAMLTSLHSELCRTLLAARCFSSASIVAEYLETEFVEISEEAAAADTKYILLYFYYGGMILTALKNYSRALYFFEVCVTIPAQAVSHIMLEAYKKYHLVFLIGCGHKPREQVVLPKYASPVVTKYIKQLCPGYHDLVNAYYSNKRDEIQNVVQRYSEAFEADQNTGLVNQVLHSQVKTSVKRLTKTFVTLSLSELATRVGLENAAAAEKLVVRMIEQGEIHAIVSQKDGGMVRFSSNPENFDTMGVLRRIEANVDECIALDTKIAGLDEKITLNPNYIKKASSTAAAAAAAAGASHRDDMETDPVGPAFPGHMMQAKMPGHLSTPPPASASTPSSSSGGVAMNGGPVVGMQPPSSSSSGSAANGGIVGSGGGAGV